LKFPNPLKTSQKEVQESEAETSSSLSAKMAIASIESFKDKNKLIEYTRGESRKTVIDALNTKLNQLNGKLQVNTDVKTEPQKEVAKPEVILEVKKEEDSKEIEELIALTSTLDKVEEETITEKKEVKIKFEEPLKPVEKPVITEPIIKEEKTTEKEPSKPVEQIKTESKPSVEKPVPPKTVQEDKALEIIAEGVTKLEKEEKKRKKKRIFLFIGLICILSGGGILGYLNKDYLISMINGESSEVAVKKEKKEEQKEEAKPTTDVEKSDEPIEVIPEEIVEEPVVEVEETVEEPVKETKAAPSSTNYSNSGNSSGDYLVIAGSFSVEANAKNLVDKLKSEGFSNAYIDSNSGSLIKVVAGTYTSKEEAKNAVDQLVSKDMKGFVQKK
jgi:septal ring-binding cell division protein DamX